MRRVLFLAASFGILAACSEFEQPVQDYGTNNDENLVESVVFEVLPIKDGDKLDTKASAIPNGTSVSFAWEVTDTVGIFPDSGSQAFFSMETGAGSSTASFNGGGWALKQGFNYTSYYPLVGEFYLDRDKIPVSFTGQKQTGTVSPFHGARYFLASNPTTSDNGVLRFSYNTLNTIINVNATLPAGTYTKASLTVNDPLFVEEGTYSLDEQTIVGKTYSNTLKIDLEDVTLTSQGVLPIYFMSAPVDLKGKEVTVKVISSDGKKYECVKTPSKTYAAGTRYGLTCDNMEQSNAGNIVFADANIKAALVAAFDTEGDGELSYMEAAAVTSIDGVFGTKKTYTSFDEFQYFTGVTSIPQSMFEGWQITSIVIPESVVTIGWYAFRDCVKLTSINIPDFVRSINGSTFSGCSRLTSITIPESVTNIGSSTFQNCSSLTNITLPEGVTSIGSNTFYGCSSLTSMTIPDGVTSIDYSAFRGCGSLTCITLPESVKSIEGCAFYGCGNLTNITIPESVTSIGSFAFYGCSSLMSIIIPEDVYKIENNTFSGCSNLTSITIPESVTSIGEGAFGNCSSLTSITIPESVTSIGEGAFRNCFSLESITIPEAVSIIEDGIFRGCISLVTITVPDAMTKIGDQAFWECGYLTSITIPSSVTSIGDRAFFSCSKLESIVCLANTPPSGVNSSTFYRTNGCGIYVPAGAVSAYKTAEGWSNYSDRIYSTEGGYVPPSGDGGDE